MQGTKPSADAYARRALARLIQHQPSVDATGAGLAFYQLFAEDDAALRAEAQAGLLAPAARVSPKFFYDALGSRLFEAITDLPSTIRPAPRPPSSACTPPRSRCAWGGARP